MRYTLCLLFIFQFSFGKAQIIPFDSSAWNYEGTGVIQEYYEGKSSLYLKASSAGLEGANFENGVIEFDIYLKDLWTFSGLFFRSKGNNYEELYFRPHRSGKPDAYQYCPHINGKASWQLYHDQHYGKFTGNPEFYPKGDLQGYNGKMDIPTDRWMHVKLVVAGQQAELYLDNEDTPRFFMNELKIESVSGPVGLYTGNGGVHYANFSLVKNPNQKLTQVQNIKVDPLENRIVYWRVSEVFEERLLSNSLPVQMTDTLKWNSLNSEPSGITNLSWLSTVKGKKNTVFAQFEVTSKSAVFREFTFGYSDRVKVYCNGQLIYAGNNGYRSRDFRFLGTIGLFDAVYLPLKEGKNIISLAVSESFGGWGVMGQLDRDQIKVKGD